MSWQWVKVWCYVGKGEVRKKKKKRLADGKTPPGMQGTIWIFLWCCLVNRKELCQRLVASSEDTKGASSGRARNLASDTEVPSELLVVWSHRSVSLMLFQTLLDGAVLLIAWLATLSILPSKQKMLLKANKLYPLSHQKLIKSTTTTRKDRSCLFVEMWGTAFTKN